MKKLALFGIIAVLLSSVFAFKDEPNPVLGRWENNSIFQGKPFSFLVIFKANGNFDGFANKKIFVSGIYHMQHDTLYIADATCNSNYFGTYKINFMGQADSIQFKVIKDTCRGRVQGTDKFVFKRVKTVTKQRAT